METLHSMLHHLSGTEKIQFGVSLKCVTANNRGRENKTHQLAIYLLKRKKIAPSNADCALHIYGKRSAGNKIYELKNQLESKLREFLVSDTSINKLKTDEHDIALIKIKKKSVLFKRLLSTDNSPNVRNEILDEIIDLSIRYEYFTCAVEHLRIKKWRGGVRHGTNEFNKINQLLRHAQLCYKAIDQAADYFHYYNAQKNTEASISPDNAMEYLSQKISVLKNDYARTKSAMVLYYLTLFEAALFEWRSEFETAREKLIQLVRIVQNNPSVKREQRIGMALANLSECEMFLGLQNESVHSAEQALKYFIPHSFNYTKAEEQLFHACFYNGNYKKAYKVLKQLTEKENRDEIGNFISDKFNFFLACIHFMKKDFSKTIHILSTEQEITKDKEGWALACRILHIMALIEKGSQNNHDAARERIECLRKSMEKEGYKTERTKLICKCLTLLNKHNFDFKKAEEAILEKIELLMSKDNDLKWNMLSPELIPFHTWLASKIKNKPLVSSK